MSDEKKIEVGGGPPFQNATKMVDELRAEVAKLTKERDDARAAREAADARYGERMRELVDVRRAAIRAFDDELAFLRKFRDAALAHVATPDDWHVYSAWHAALAEAKKKRAG